MKVGYTYILYLLMPLKRNFVKNVLSVSVLSLSNSWSPWRTCTCILTRRLVIVGILTYLSTSGCYQGDEPVRDARRLVTCCQGNHDRSPKHYRGPCHIQPQFCLQNLQPSQKCTRRRSTIGGQFVDVVRICHTTFSKQFWGLVCLNK